MSQLSLHIQRKRGEIEPWAGDDAGRWHLVKADCIETMAKIGDQSIDLTFADPPYFLSKQGGTSCRAGERVSVAKGEWDRPIGVEDQHAFHRAWLEQVRAVLKPSGTVWVSGTHHVIFSVGFVMQQLGFHILNMVTWRKPAPTPNLSCRMFTHATEFLIWASPKERDPQQHVFNYADMKRENGGKQMQDIWTVHRPHAREKVHGSHSCQKPEALLDRIIRASTNPGAMILDPFCGSGTTGAVAMRLGRRFIGIDLEEENLIIARKRLESAL